MVLVERRSVLSVIFSCCWILISLGGCVVWASELGYHQEAVNYDGHALLEKLKNGGVPQDIPANFDCEARYLAYNVSLKTQPTRAPMKEVWDALELTTLCKKTFNPRAGQALKEALKAGRELELQPVDYRVFVDTKRGNDYSDEPSRRDKPLRGVARALEHVREFRRHVRAAGKRSDAPPTVSITLRGGVHYLNETMEINAEDSSTTLESYPGETAVLSGGKPLSPAWKPYNVSTKPQMVVQSGDNVWGLMPGGPGSNTSTIK